MDNNQLNAIITQQQQMEDASNQQPATPRYNHPCGDLLLGERRRDYIRTCVPLYEASIKGDWRAASVILHDQPNLVRYSITENKETSLHIASTAQSLHFVKELVNKMNNTDLALQNDQGYTAFCLAAGAGNIEMAEVMFARNPELLTIRGEGMMPLHLAALYAKGEMVRYLYEVSKGMRSDDWTDKDKCQIFLKCIEADLYDVALKILNVEELEPPQLKYAWDALHLLARKPGAFMDKKPRTVCRFFIDSLSLCFKEEPTTKEIEATQLLTEFWEKIVEKPKNVINDILRGPEIYVENPQGGTCDVSEVPDTIKMNPYRITFVAAEMGNIKFLVQLIRKYPDLIWKKNDNGQTIFHIAVSHRHVSIYNILYEIGSLKDTITPQKDRQGNNMLHLVGMKAERNPLEEVSGAAFQMQRELLWFKEVQDMIPPSCREDPNDAGYTPLQLFIENHKELVSRGEKWMKGTANQCMVVAALITTVVFSVAFTIPGGYNQNSGIPIFHQKAAFIAFVIFDAISLILSSASILMFLSILTSRYSQDDFLESLPVKLMIGLTTLFLSIITMMVAFAISFFVLYHDRFIPVPIIIGVIAIVPVYLYIRLQFPLLLDVYGSTYGSRYLFKPTKCMLYYQNPTF